MKVVDIELDGHRTFAKLLILWHDNEGHFGEIGIRTEKDKVYINSECMSREFVKDVLNKLVDVAIFDWEVES